MIDHLRGRLMKPRTAKISISGTSVETTPVFESFWKFAAERQSIFFRRLRGTNHSALTEDDVLQAYKFTNSYRASDRVSQFLIREVIYEEDVPSDPENQFFRIMLFKLFNKIETWQLLLHPRRTHKRLHRVCRRIDMQPWQLYGVPSANCRCN